MRVLFVNENIGGHRTMHRHLEAALADHSEIDATFVHLERPGPIRRVVGARIPGLARFDLDLQPLRAQLAAAWLARRQAAALVDRADVVHWYTHNSALLSCDLMRSRPSVVSLDKTNSLNNFQLPYRHPTRFTPRVAQLGERLDRRVYEAATRILAKSEWAARSVRDDYDVPAEKVHVLPFGILPGPPPVRRPPARPMLAFVGTSLARKGGEQLLRVWRERLRDRCDLTLVTKQHVDPEPGVAVHTDLDEGGEIAEVLSRCTVFVFPSEIDSSPHAVFEAMAAGLPVVAARSGGMPEQVTDGQTGFLVPVGDDAALAAAITALIDDPSRAAAFGAAGRHALETNFSMTHSVPKLIDHLEAARTAWHTSPTPT